MWDEISERYRSWTLDHRWLYYLTGLDVKKRVSRANYILDVGSGPGIFAEELGILFPNSEIVCLDASLEMCKLSRGVRSGASFLPFKDEIFDIVTFIFSLHELEIDLALEEANRVLKKDGIIYVVDLNRDAPQTIKNASKLILEKIIGRDYAEYLENTWNAFRSCEEIAEKLKAMGLEVECRKGLQEIRIVAKKI